MGCKINVSRVVRCPNISCFPAANPRPRAPRLYPSSVHALALQAIGSYSFLKGPAAFLRLTSVVCLRERVNY